MSRLYGMSIKITEHDKSKARDIFAAIKKEWEIEDCRDVPLNKEGNRFLLAYGESYLCGGESEEEFADRVAQAIWKANSGYCHIQVEAIYLEDLPWETHVRDAEDYHHLVEQERK